MNHKLLALFSIIVSIGMLTVTIASTSLAAMTAFAQGEKCISIESNDGRPSLGCSTYKQDEVFSGEAKKECRETASKCSSSQTGFGAQKNVKP